MAEQKRARNAAYQRAGVRAATPWRAAILTWLSVIC
jgi:hypothetical protein